MASKDLFWPEVGTDRSGVYHPENPHSGQSIHDRVERHAALTPDAVAASCDGQSLTYAELNAQANRLAHHLIARGVTTGQLVGLHCARGLNTIVGILGILKAGGAYLPMDPVYPAERMAFMLEDSGAEVVVTETALASNVEAAGIEALCFEDLTGGPEDNPGLSIGGGDLAYVIYTSGSTGKPKGALITHHNVTRLFDRTEHFYVFGPDDVWTMFHSYSFDFSVWEIWGALFYGGRVVVVPTEVSRSTEAFRDLVEAEGVTVLNQTPSAFRQFIKADLARDPASYALRYVIFGGEALEFQSLRPWFDRYGDARPQLVNMYGITETTVHVTYRAVSLADLDSGQGSVIGEPIPDLDLHILGEDMRPLPPGEMGEMYVGGAGVALGYLNRPELTAARFLPDTLSGRPGRRLYRTGDLARRLENGDIEYLGRIDHQVKIRGFRIELGEIEAAIATYPGIQDVTVQVREDREDDQRIVAYVVHDLGEVDLTETLRAHLKSGLPDYMLPSHVMRLPVLPLTENGKIDRRALPAPDYGTSRAEFVAPSTPGEEAVAAVWCEVLGLESVGVNDNFFELGGHSLMVIDVIQRLRARGHEVEASRLFLDPTIAAIAPHLTDGTQEAALAPSRVPDDVARLTPDMLPLVDLTQAEADALAAQVPGGAANIADAYPMTQLQEGMVYHHRTAPGADTYLVTTLIAAGTRAEAMGYAEALQQVVDRHDVLRSAFLWDGLPMPVQVVLRRAPIAIQEVTLDPEAGDGAAQMLERFDPRNVTMDIRSAPVMRLYIAEDTARGRWLVLRLHHHLLEDHTADELMNHEIAAILRGEGDALPAPLPFRDFVMRRRAAAKDPSHAAYFAQMLGDVTEPTDAFGFGAETGGHEGLRDARRLVDPSLARRIRKAANARKVSAASLFHLAWATVVARTARREDVVFGTVLFGRMHAGPGAERAMGPLINTLPMRLDLAGASVADALAATHARMGELLRHENAALADAQRQGGAGGGAPLFNALLNFRHVTIEGAVSPDMPHAMAGAIDAMGLELIRFEERTNYPLEMSVDDLGEDFMMEAQVHRPIAPADICEHVHAALEGIVSALETAPDTPAAAVTILTEGQRDALVAAPNDTARALAFETLPQMVAAQASERPDHVATRAEGGVMTYGEVEAQSNRMAHALRARGIGRGDLVGLCLDRDETLPAALLGVMKAGAGYVPLDPDFPADRLRFMAEDASLALLIADDGHETLFGEGTGAVLTTRQLDVEMAGQPDTAPTPDEARDARPGDTAYVIYTSGSTGKPKGVVVQHEAAVNFLSSMARTPGLTPEDRLVAVTTLSFDIALLELLLPLVTGASVTVATRRHAGNPEALATLLDEATIMQATPATWRMLLAHGWQAAPGLRALIGGEALPKDLADTLIAQGAEVWNMYGPTETTVWSSCTRITATDGGITIGRPIDNTALYVLDASGTPCPAGVAGELYIGGLGVTRGYLERPSLTHEKFVADPFAKGRFGPAQPRMFRTGDGALRRADGTVEHLGRLDHQVKLRGYRIELGEIETALRGAPGVSDAAVLLREDTPGDQRLVGYVVTAGGDAAPLDGLRARLAKGLPSYMVPSAFVALEALPLTPNAKVDRRALPAPDGAGPAQDREAPATRAERQLAAIWGEVLGTEEIGRDDDFFDLGGHSLLAMEVLARVERDMGLRLPVRAMLETPTLRAVALAAGGERASSLPDGIVRVHEGSAERALFCIPGLGGVALQYKNMAAVMTTDRPVYSVELYDIERGDGAPDLAAMAGVVADLMQQVQSEGPYAVLGYSFGGNLAVEVAAELQARGETVEDIFVIDAFAPGSYTLGSPLTRALRHCRNMLRRLRRPGEFTAYVAPRIRRRLGLAPGEETDLERKLREARDVGTAASRNYDGRRVSGTIRLVQARDPYEWIEVTDPTGTNGWQGFCDEVQAIVIDCAHLDMFSQPHLGRLADHVTACLSQGRRG